MSLGETGLVRCESSGRDTWNVNDSPEFDGPLGATDATSQWLRADWGPASAESSSFLWKQWEGDTHVLVPAGGPGTA